MTPCGQRGEEEQTECFDGRTDKIASAARPTYRPPPVSLPESPWVGSLAFLPTTARRDAFLPPSLTTLPSPFLPSLTFIRAMPYHATHYELLTGLFGAAASQRERRAILFVRRKKGRQNPWTMNTYLPNSGRATGVACLIMMMGMGFWKWRGCLLAAK